MASSLLTSLRWYKKPDYVEYKSFVTSLNMKEEKSSYSPRSSVISQKTDFSIPKNLALERILENKTCSPMSLYDFYMYLKHIEFSQENLEFYTWFKDYEKRYEEKVAADKNNVIVSVEPVTPSDTNSLPSHRERNPFGETQSIDSKDSHVCEYSDDSQTRLSLTLPASEFTSFIESLVLSKASRYPKPCCPILPVSSTKLCDMPSTTSLSTLPQPPHTQQHHEELQQIISLFLTTDAPKELNIPPSMRKLAIQNLSTSSDPAHLTKIANHIYALLRDCSHRNFVRLGVNNGTFETLCMVTFVGIFSTCLGFLIMFILAFGSPSIHHSSRWRAIGIIPCWFVGISFLLAGMRGSCFLLLLFSRRQELPWERVGLVEDEKRATDFAHPTVPNKPNRNPIARFAKKLMIFERKIRVKDMGLRSLQRKIVLQSVAGAVIGTAILMVFFLCLPIWRPL